MRSCIWDRATAERIAEQNGGKVYSYQHSCGATAFGVAGPVPVLTYEVGNSTSRGNLWGEVR